MTDVPPPASDAPEAAAAALEEAVGLAFRVLKGIMVLLVLLFLVSGSFTIESHEVGFVRHAGVLDREDPQGPGLHWCWPVLDDVVRVDTRPVTHSLETFDLHRTPREQVENLPPRREGGLDPRKDGYLLTSDANLVHVTLAARVVPVAPYHQAQVTVEDPDELIAVLLERAAVRSAVRIDVSTLLGKGKASFLQAIKRELEEALTGIEAGYGVQGIDLVRDLAPPPQTRDAFDQVTKANQKADAFRSEAKTDALKIVSAAEAEANRMEQDALTRAKRIEDSAQSDVELFSAQRLLLEDDPTGSKRRTLEDRLLTRVLAEAMEEVGEVFLVGSGTLRLRLERDVTRVRQELYEEAKARAR